MAKEVAGLIKLQIKGGAANPSPPVGPALGSKGINIMEFCKQFNARTQDKAGKILPVIISLNYASSGLFFCSPTANLALMKSPNRQDSPHQDISVRYSNNIQDIHPHNTKKSTHKYPIFLRWNGSYRMQLQQITAPVPHQTNNITHCSFSIE